MKRQIDERTKQVKIVKLHEGIVVQDCHSFVRVFNPVSPDKGGDLLPETSELFALNSARVWCEVVSERSTPFPIPPALRF